MAVILAAAVILSSPKNPVPRQLRKSVSFPVYYPVNGRLPEGYALEPSSFRLAQPGVVIFSISHTGGQHLIFSEEAQQPSGTVSDFVKNYIPLHSALNTRLGTAQVGAYGRPPDLRTVVSLQINKGPWLVITAPSDISQDDLKKILQVFSK